MRWIAVIGAELVVLALAGCAGDQIKELGGGRHSVSACSDSGLTNPQVKAVQAADKYCGKFGQMAVVQKFDADSCAKAATTAVTAEFTCR
jgi:hypothetical protein